MNKLRGGETLRYDGLFDSQCEIKSSNGALKSTCETDEKLRWRG